MRRATAALASFAAAGIAAAVLVGVTSGDEPSPAPNDRQPMLTHQEELDRQAEAQDDQRRKALDELERKVDEQAAQNAAVDD